MPHAASNGNSKDRNCAIMLHNYDGKWYDHTCSSDFPYICESNFCKFIILLFYFVDNIIDLKK
jgi:hypothetical protein